VASGLDGSPRTRAAAVRDAAVVFLNIHAPNMRFAEMLRAARDGRDEDAGEFDQFEPPADGGRPLSDAVFRGPGEGEPIQIGEGRAILKAYGPAVGGFFSLTETTLAPGFQGHALNRDGALLDGFYVLEGTLHIEVEGAPYTLTAGDTLTFDAGAPHRPGGEHEPARRREALWGEGKKVEIRANGIR
jgi:mannose-6-phosphate isomerase-like protein (cupin superfamily)